MFYYSAANGKNIHIGQQILKQYIKMIVVYGSVKA